MSVSRFYRGGERMENNKNLRDMVLEHQLKSIHFDFENRVFEINGINIGYCTDVDICFHDSKWSISLGENKNYNVSGFMVKKDTAQIS